MELLQDWMHFKNMEDEAREARRLIEKQLNYFFKIPVEFSGSKTKKMEGYEIKISGRLNKKVDQQALQEIAAENDLGAYLDTLFRWKAEVKARDWEKCDPRVTEKLSSAITESYSMPTYKITFTEE